MLGSKRHLSTRRIWLARSIAMAADLVQIGLFPTFAEGAFSPFDLILDIIVGSLLVLLVGWHIAFLPGAVMELVPIADLAPTWTIAAFIATRNRELKKLE